MDKNELIGNYVEIIGKGYSTGDFSELFPYLSENCVFESQWVMTPMEGKENIVDYFEGKGQTLIKNKTLPECYKVRLVGNMNLVECDPIFNGEKQDRSRVGLWYEEGKYCLLSVQALNGNRNGMITDITVDADGMITRIDNCMPGLFNFDIIERINR